MPKSKAPVVVGALVATGTLLYLVSKAKAAPEEELEPPEIPPEPHIPPEEPPPEVPPEEPPPEVPPPVELANLSGTVRDRYGAGMHGVRVQLKSWPDRLADEVMTDSWGVFIMDNINPGYYYLVFQKAGYEPVVIN